MARTRQIYSNCNVIVELERCKGENEIDHKVNFNDETLIWISIDDVDEFAREFKELMDKYRI